MGRETLLVPECAPLTILLIMQDSRSLVPYMVQASLLAGLGRTTEPLKRRSHHVRGFRLVRKLGSAARANIKRTGGRKTRRSATAGRSIHMWQA